VDIYIQQKNKLNMEFNLNNLSLSHNGSVRTFKILDDGLESLTLQTTGLWPQSSSGPNQIVTLQLTRDGP